MTLSLARMNLANIISFLRIPLAFGIFIPSVTAKLVVLAIGGLSDWVDGWLARKYNMETRLGVLLDPISDRFFVLVAFIHLSSQLDLGMSAFVLFFARDIFTLVGTIIVKLAAITVQITPMVTGKITTALQVFTLFVMVIDTTVVVPLIQTIGIVSILNMMGHVNRFVQMR